MVTFAQAQERAEDWINGDVPSYQHREVRVREFELGFVVWGEDRAEGPRSDAGAQRLVIARDSGEATLWPALPVGEVIRRYEEEYGRPEQPGEAVAAPAARVDLNQTSFLLTPPEWLLEAADKLGMSEGRSSDGGGSSDGSGSAGAKPGVPLVPSAAGERTSGSAAGTAGSGSGAASAGGSGGVTPWAGTDTNGDGGEDRSVPLPETVSSPPGGDPEGDGAPSGAAPDAGTAQRSDDGRSPRTAAEPSVGDSNASGTPQDGTPSSSGEPRDSVPPSPSLSPSSPPSDAPSYGYPQGPVASGTPPPGAPEWFVQQAMTKSAAPSAGGAPGMPPPPPFPPQAPGVPGVPGVPGAPGVPGVFAAPSGAPQSMPPGATPPPGPPGPSVPSAPGQPVAGQPSASGAPVPGQPVPGQVAPVPGRPVSVPGQVAPAPAPSVPGPVPSAPAPVPPVPPPVPSAPAPVPPVPPPVPSAPAPVPSAAPPVPSAPAPVPSAAPPVPSVPGPPPAYGYPQQAQPTVGPGYQAVLRYRAQDGSEQQLIRRSAPGTPHPEWQIFHELRAMGVPPDQVLELHTELESCELPGAYCARMIREQWPQARITSIAPYGRDHASRQQGMGQLLAHQGELHQVADGPARPAPMRAPLPAVQAVPPVPPEGVAQELAAAFGPGVFHFEHAAVDRQGVPPVVAQTLIVAGLPVDMGPFFWAQAQPGRPVPTLAELAQERGVQPAADAGSYLVMGSDFGRSLCVQYGTANIVAVPMEAGPGGASVPPQFVNTGLPEFVRCLALLGRMWRLRYGLTQEQAGRWTVDFQAQLAALDPAALGSAESWWSVLLEQMWDGLL
jgi:SUKH-4 immunity protein of toxin-antitoxin system/nucleic acid/nucleotide deaminase of polymorphic system toxin